ncbi:MAG: hypothetical protein ACLQBD_17140 [Syntrophobacteraceae bacterium]
MEKEGCIKVEPAIRGEGFIYPGLNLRKTNPYSGDVIILPFAVTAQAKVAWATQV